MDSVEFLQSVIWDGDSVLSLMVRVTRAALVLVQEADGAAVELLEEDGTLVYRCAEGSLRGREGLRLRASSSLSGLAAAAGATMVATDTTDDPRVDREACRRLGIASMVCVPLWRGRAVVGVLKVASSQVGAFDQATAGLLSGLGEFIGAAVTGASDLALATTRLLTTASTPGWEATGSGSREALAEFVARVVRPVAVSDVSIHNRITEVIDRQAFKVVCQPVVDLRTGHTVGFEALTRFTGEPARPPDQWFAEAHSCGLGVLLELSAASAALELVEQLPSGVSLAVNAGPALAAHPAFSALVELAGPARVIIELTEHAPVDDYPHLVDLLTPLRQQGARLAVDDTGGGFSSLTHIVRLGPEIIKLDRFLTSRVEDDPVRRALATALVKFAEDVGARVVAEGIETDDQMRVLIELGVRLGQGYRLGRPAPLESFRPQIGLRRHAAVG
jgi:EAL domain-containing protein (putative c-di-GMP-specific phosphodiesterase class I)/putative methionine-R-sulfoxide reductase with GAF domain